MSTDGTQVATLNRGVIDEYLGGVFTVTDNAGSRTVTSITVTESGTVDEVVDIDTIKLFYETDTSLPYDCSSESYGGTETQFGSNGVFSAAGTSTFTDTVAISDTATLCVYPVVSLAATTRMRCRSICRLAIHRAT